MTSLTEMAAAAREIPPDVLAQFDAVFARPVLDPRNLTMDAVLSAMRPTVIPANDKENS